MISFIKNWPKLVAFMLLALIGLGYAAYSRVPPAMQCAWEAAWIDDMPADKWRFNWTPSKYSKQCQRKRADGSWIAYSKASDVGLEDGEME